MTQQHVIVKNDERNGLRTQTCSCGYWVASGSAYVHIWFDEHRKRVVADDEAGK